ncbi:MAG: hypothetical protein E7187_02315 [Erysipelotrichaceae bacterium]|nr:hypothetical protein [Erysipelotrichaceae bacterium]
MPKSRLFVVNDDTYRNTIESGIASIIMPAPTGQQWLKTFSDIMADMLQISIGDYIFFWKTRNKENKSEIYGVYRAISKPFYRCDDKNDIAPFKIHIEKAYDFCEPIEEYDALNNPYAKNSLWTLSGKKISGKSRGTSPLSMEESKYLIDLLIGKNPDYIFIPFDSSRIIEVQSELAVNYTNTTNKNYRSLQEINPSELSFISENNVRYEKILETIFNQELTRKNALFFRPIGIDVDKVIWYCNYLPYSIERSEIDYMIIQSDDGFSQTQVFVIEFQKGQIDKDHIFRTFVYSKWVSETIAFGENLVQPILICNKYKDGIDEIIETFEKDFQSKRVKVYTYDIDSTAAKISFTQKR